MVAMKKSPVLGGKAKQTFGKKPVAKSHPLAEEATITIDRRMRKDRRQAQGHQTGHVPVNAEHRGGERRKKVNRRRQIDPTTCERDYTPDEIEFMSAMDGYKRRSGRMFPTCSEVLEVIRSLGYEKRPKPQDMTRPLAGLPFSTPDSPAEQTILSAEAW